MAGDPSEPSALSRRDRRKLEVYERVLEAAEALFEAQGYDETKVAAICESADVAYGTFFNHFPAKVDILHALADRSIQRIGERLEELTKRDGSIEDLLIELFEGDAALFESLPAGRRLLAGRIQTLAYSDHPEDRGRRFHGLFEEFLRRCIDDGRVRTDVPVETLAEVLSATFAQGSLSWVHFDDYPIRERAAAAARFLASTLAPRRGRTNQPDASIF